MADEVQKVAAQGCGFGSLVGSLLRPVHRCFAGRQRHKNNAAKWFSGNLAPVQEETCAAQMEVVEGNLPSDLVGAFVYNSPNAQHPSIGGHFWFDGDAMIHAVRLNGKGNALYSSSWVLTSRFLNEQREGWAFMPRAADLMGARAMGVGCLAVFYLTARMFRVCDGVMNANISVTYHAGRLMANHEMDLPYLLRFDENAVLSTLGRRRFKFLASASKATKTTRRGLGGQFTAHPKTDPVTGELHFMNYNPFFRPYAVYGCLDAEGNLKGVLPLSLPHPVMIHDMAITESYALCLDNPYAFSIGHAVAKNTPAFYFEPKYGSRIGLIRRSIMDDDASKDMKSASTSTSTSTQRDEEAVVTWISLDTPCWIFHTVNSWEEKDIDGTIIIKLYAVSYETFNFDITTFSISSDPKEMPYLTEFTLSVRDETCIARRLSAVPCELPVANTAFIGRRSRWTWAISDSEKPEEMLFSSDCLVKMDLWAAEGTDAHVARVQMPKGSFLRESQFAPRVGGKLVGLEAEDDGYLLAFQHDEGVGESSLGIWDARTMVPVAKLKAPHRVPYGFHGLWLTEQQFMAHQARYAKAAAAAGHEDEVIEKMKLEGL